MAESTCIINSKVIQCRWIIQRVVWALPETNAECPHGLKFCLFCGDAERCCLVRYDNEAGKGDH